MPAVRHVIVCEGDSERAYLQRLQSFLDAQPLPSKTFEPPLQFIGPMNATAKTGSFGKIVNTFNKTRRNNKRAPSIHIWADFDLYHRNDGCCADQYAAKPAGIPHFLFSFHNFEDDRLDMWPRFGSPQGRNHFAAPLHKEGYLPEAGRIFPGYRKGEMSPDFISWASLGNVKNNLARQPSSNPHNLVGIRAFADFLIEQIERAYPNLKPTCSPPEPP
jgi:hypothetical protein